MKNYSSIIQIFSLACACLIAAGSGSQAGAATAASSNSGHLLVYRAAKFGDRLNIVLSVDGKRVASLTKGQRYDGYLPTGQHVLMAEVTPNKMGARPARMTMTIQAGQTSSYTATLSGGNLALVRK
jgi:hypothetical protein